MNQFYSPNANNTGAALFASFNSKEGVCYWKFLQQTGWDTGTKKGSFKDGKYINFKLSQDEVGAVIEAIRNKGQTSFYHQFDGAVTTGSFNYYSIEPKVAGGKAKVGFGLKVKKDNMELKVGFTLGSAERFMEFLRFSLDHIFSAEYSAEKKRNEEYLKNKAAAPAKKLAPTDEIDPSDFVQDNDEFSSDSTGPVDF